MWWKIYFWILFILTTIGLFPILQYAPFKIADIISVLLNLVLVVATYTYVYKKRVLQRKQWKIILWIVIFLFIEEMLELYVLPKDFIATLLPFWKSSFPFSSGERLFSWLMSLPAVYATYKLSLGQ